MMKLWEGDDFIDDNTLTVNITRIRKKLKTMGIDDYIITKKGIGYTRSSVFIFKMEAHILIGVKPKLEWSEKEGKWLWGLQPM